MNKFTGIAAFMVCSALFMSCDLSNTNEEFIDGDFHKFVLIEQDDSTTFNAIDNLGIKDTYSEHTYKHVNEYYEYTANGDLNQITVKVRFECTDDGGNFIVYECKTVENPQHMNDNGIVFKNLHGNKMTHKDGYTITMLDSMKVGNKTYKDVLKFDATKAKENECIYDKFYIAAKEGLIRIDLLDSITIERTSKKK